MTPRLVAHISAPALRHNLDIVRQRAPGCRIMAVVKANAYGHGVIEVAGVLTDVDALAVARVEEGILLREAGIPTPLVVLGGFLDVPEVQACMQHDLQPVVHHLEQARLLAGAPADRLAVWVKVDSGMGRLGLPVDSLPEVMDALGAAKSVSNIQGVMTHLACADETDAMLNLRQIKRFQELVASWDGDVSVANSAAILSEQDNLAPARARPGGADNWVRPGIMLYGASPFDDVPAGDLGLRPAMELQAPVMAVRQFSPGASVGYGAEWTAARDSIIAVVAAGYGDGYPRALGNRGRVLVRGRTASVVGRVSMDSISIDVTDVPGVEIGDPVTLWGADLPVEETARLVGTISYEILCGVAQRVSRRVREA